MINKLKNHFIENTEKLGNPYQLKKAAVFLPLVFQNNQWEILFEVRASTLHRQPGDICFPGGKIDSSDHSPLDAAKRETCEELGLQQDDFSIIGSMDYFVSPLGMIIYPFCGQILHPDKLSPNKDEVESIFTVPVQWLLDNPPTIHPLKIASQFSPSPTLPNLPQINAGNWRTMGNINVRFFFFQDKIIWGLTAELTHFLINIIAEDNAIFQIN